ncbi:MAG: glycoside hydrolase [Pirellulaceae bacterium]|nr:glycoside hydrolase [Pirellulaceae bacterium]
MSTSPSLEVLDSGHVDRSESAFATPVLLDSGDVLCGYSAGGGAHAMGGTHCSISRDGGQTWQYRSVVLAGVDDPPRFNHLRLSRTTEGAILAYGQRDGKELRDGELQRVNPEIVFCRSDDEGQTWSEPAVIPSPIPGPYEVSNPLVVVSDGRWLGPAATYHDGLYGELVVLHETSDEGRTWPSLHTIFEHPGKRVGFLEQKVIECQPNRLLAIAWRQDYQADVDLDNAISFSSDGGRSWSEPLATGVQGQTMTPVWLGDDRFCILYNRRVGQQGVRMCLVRANESEWTIDFEDMLWDAQSEFNLTADTSSNDEIPNFKFGYPMGILLDETTILTTHWCVEEKRCGIRWSRVRINH